MIKFEVGRPKIWSATLAWNRNQHFASAAATTAAADADSHGVKNKVLRKQQQNLRTNAHTDTQAGREGERERLTGELLALSVSFCVHSLACLHASPIGRSGRAAQRTLAVAVEPSVRPSVCESVWLAARSFGGPFVRSFVGSHTT